MIFNVSGEDFKAAVDKALVIKPMSRGIFSYLKIATGKDTDGSDCVTVSNVNCINAGVFVRIRANVVQQGETFVERDNIQKIYGLTGNVVIESSDSVISSNNGKRHCCTKCVDEMKDNTAYHVHPYTSSFIINQNDLMTILSKTEAARSFEEYRNILTGFHFDANENCVVALDGYRMHVAKIPAVLSLTGGSFTAPGFIYEHLKKLIAKNKGSAIHVDVSRTFVRFTSVGGNHFEYYANLLEGKYVDWKNIIPTSSGSRFDIDCGELIAITKDYLASTAKEMNPNNVMWYVVDEENFVTVSIDNEFSVSDKLEKAKIISIEKQLCGKFVISFNSSYMKDALAIFGKGNAVMLCNKPVHPIVVKDDTYTAVVLPVRTTQDVNEVINFAKKIA